MDKLGSLEEATPRSWRLETSTVLVILLLVVVCFLVLTPLIWLLFKSFQVSQPWQPAVYGLAGWQQAFTSPGILSATYNTFALAITRQLIALVLGIAVAWLLARTDIPMKGWLEFMFWLSFFMPALPITLGWILAFHPSVGLVNRWLAQLPFIDGHLFNIYSFWGIIFAHLTTGSIAIKVMLLTPAFRNMDAALEEASRAAGAGSLTTLLRITIMLMAPVILVSTILGFIRSLEAFEIELVLGLPIGLHVYSTKIYDFIRWDPAGGFSPATALGSLFLLVLLVLAALQYLYLGRRHYTTVTAHFSNRPIQLGSWKYIFFVAILALVLFVTVVPFALLVMGTFMTIFGFFDIPSPWTFEHWRAVLRDPVLGLSIRNTLAIALGSALLGILFYSAIAYVIVKTKFAVRGALDFLSWLPWAIPGILLGVGLLWTFLQTPGISELQGTIYLMIIALVIKSMPSGVQLTKSILLQLSAEFEEASRICGASWVHTFRRVLLPLLWPMFMVIGLLAFNSAARDISTVVLLGSGDSRTLSLLMLEWAIGGGYIERATVVGVIIVILVVITAVIARAVGSKASVTW